MRDGRGRDQRDEGGVAVLEFALVATLLFTLIFGIIAFGLVLQRKQQGVQAAAEGARAAVPVPFSDDPTRSDYLFRHLVDASVLEPAPVTRARQAVDESMGDTGRTCTRGDTDDVEAGVPDGLRCSISLVSCTDSTVEYTLVLFQVDAVDGRTDDACIRVRLVDENSGDHAVSPPLPLIQNAIPSALRSTSVAELGGLIQ